VALRPRLLPGVPWLAGWLKDPLNLWPGTDTVNPQELQLSALWRGEHSVSLVLPPGPLKGGLTSPAIRHRIPPQWRMSRDASP